MVRHLFIIVYLLIKTGSESIKATLRRRRILFAVLVARMEDTRRSKCVMFGDFVGGETVWGPGKIDRVFPVRFHRFWHQRRPGDDCSSGRGRMTRDGGTRGGTFYGEMDRCRENQGGTTAYSSMPECDG